MTKASVTWSGRLISNFLDSPSRSSWVSATLRSFRFCFFTLFPRMYSCQGMSGFSGRCDGTNGLLALPAIVGNRGHGEIIPHVLEMVYGYARNGLGVSSEPFEVFSVG